MPKPESVAVRVPWRAPLGDYPTTHALRQGTLASSVVDRHGARTLNHVIVVRESLASDDEAMRELFRIFRASREIAGTAVDGVSTPLGLEANRRNLEVAIAVADAQGLLARPLTVDDLVTDVVASLR